MRENQDLRRGIVEMENRGRGAHAFSLYIREAFICLPVSLSLRFLFYLFLVIPLLLIKSKEMEFVAEKVRQRIYKYRERLGLAILWCKNIWRSLKSDDRRDDDLLFLKNLISKIYIYVSVFIIFYYYIYIFWIDSEIMHYFFRN